MLTCLPGLRGADEWRTARLCVRFLGISLFYRTLVFRRRFVSEDGEIYRVLSYTYEMTLFTPRFQQTSDFCAQKHQIAMMYVDGVL